MQDDSFPPLIKQIQAEDYTLKIVIKKENIEAHDKIYEINGIFHGWKMTEEVVDSATTEPLTTTSTAAVISQS